MEQAEQPRASLASLFAIFLKVGNLTFGGGDPTMAVLQREFCERRQWLTQEQYALAYSLARITPGTNVLAFCVAAAQMMNGWPSAVAAVVAASGPSAVIAVLLTIFYEHSTANPVATAAVAGVLAAVVGMMGATALALVRPHLKRNTWGRAVAIFGGAFMLRQLLNLSPLQILIIAVIADAVWKEPVTQ